MLPTSKSLNQIVSDDLNKNKKYYSDQKKKEVFLD